MSDYTAPSTGDMDNRRTPGILLLILLLSLTCNCQLDDLETTCDYYTSRIFHIEASKEDALTITIRQNVRGQVRFVEQPRELAGLPQGQIAVLVNWTSNDAALLDSVQSEWMTIDTIAGKSVIIQLDADSPEAVQAVAISVVVGSSVAGGVTFLAILAIAAVLIVKRKDCCRSAKADCNEANKEKNCGSDGRTVEEDEYDGTIYPDSIFGTQQDNASHDESTLNLSYLHAEQASEGHSYRRTNCNVSTDQASVYSVPSLSRQSAKSGTPQPEQMAMLPLIHSPWRRATYGRHLSAELDYTRPLGPIQVLPPKAPSHGSPSTSNRLSGETAPAHQMPPKLSSFSQLPGPNGNAGSEAAGKRLRSPLQLRARYLAPQHGMRWGSAFPAMPPSPLTTSATEDEGDEEEGEPSFDDETAGNREDETGSEGCCGDDRRNADAGELPLLGVPREFLSSEEVSRDDSGAIRPQVVRVYSVARAPLPSSLVHASLAALTIVSVLTGSAFTFCNSKPLAHVVFYVPIEVNIVAIKLFANRELQPSIVENRWYLENKELFQVYDVEDASVSQNKPCSTKYECPSANNRSLVECDLGTQKCVCTRGYNINSRFICEDIDECRNGGDDVCPPGTSCRNIAGSFECLCPVGFYRSGTECTACSTGCPTNQYQLKQCTPTSDRVCSVCQKCPSGTYTFRPCTTKSDTTCMHISRPNEYSQQQGASLIKEKVKVTAPPNVFVEDLSPPPGPAAASLGLPAYGSLEQTVYVGENSQRMSFSWQRPSGIRILVELSEFGLVPQYESVQHPTDENQYLRQLRDDGGLRSTYDDIRENYCSQPIPDYYVLMLMIYRRRSTAVEHITCNVDQKNCPAKYQNGQTYARRSANRACPKESRNPASVPDTANSLLCTERTALLTQLFPEAAATFAKDEALNFPPSACRELMMVCKNCLTEKCQGLSPSCCAARCHATPECKNISSLACNNILAECATGDLAQYILQPYFSANEFRCHVKRKSAERLVRITYHAAAPNGWNSSPQTADVPMTSEFAGSTATSFFSVKYSSLLNASGDGTLLSGVSSSSNPGEYTFSILSPRRLSPAEATTVSQSKAPEVAAPVSSLYSNNAWMARVQSAKPFAVNTQTWRTEQGCEVDPGSLTSPLRVLPLSEEGRRRLDNLLFDTIPVEVTARRQAAQLSYTVKTRSLPWLRLSLAGNQSVLQHFFDSPTVDRKSVKVELVSSVSQMGAPSDAWELLITGRVLSCGSYVSITVTDRTTLSTLARYDCLVSCVGRESTASFFVKILIPVPPPSEDSAIGQGSRNKLLQVDVSDATGSASHFVTTYAGGNAPEASSDQSPVQVPSRNDDNRTENDRQQTVVHIGVVVLAAAVATSCLYALVHLGCLGAKRCHRAPATQLSSPATSKGSQSDCPVKSSPRRIALITVFCLYKLAYSVTFSSTALFFLTTSFNNGAVDTLQSLATFHQSVMSNVASDLRSVHSWRIGEIERQHAAFDERLAACTQYATSKRWELSGRVAGMMTKAADAKRDFEEVKLGSLMTKVLDFRSRTVELATGYRRNVTRRTSDLFFVYNTFLDEVYASDWLKMAKANFQSSLLFEKSLSQRDVTTPELLPSEKAAFLDFLGTERPSSAAKQVESIIRRSDNVKDISQTVFSEAVLSSLPDGLYGPAIYRKLLSRPAAAFSPQHIPFRASEMTSPAMNRSLTIFKAVLATIDVLLFSYRFLSALKTARALAYEFEELHRTSGSSDSNDGASSRDAKRASVIQRELDVIRRQITMAGRRSAGSALRERSQIDSAAEDAAVSHCPATRQSCSLAIRGPVGCRIAIWLASVALLLLTAATLDEMLTRRAVLRATAIDRLAGSAAAYAAASEAYARYHAGTLTQAADAAMRREFNPTLHYLLRHDALHEYEMGWFFRLYDTRRCSIVGFSEENCDFAASSNVSGAAITVGFPPSTGQTRIDVTPCQALPVTARQIPGSLLKVSAAVLSNDFQKYSNALRDVTLTTVGMILLFTNLIVILHLAELFVMKIFRAKNWTHQLRVQVRQDSSYGEATDKDDAATLKHHEEAANTATTVENRGNPRETLSVASDRKSVRSELKSTLSSARSTTRSACGANGGPASCKSASAYSDKSDDSRRRLRVEPAPYEADLSNYACGPQGVRRPAPASRLHASSSRSSDASASAGSRTPSQFT